MKFKLLIIFLFILSIGESQSILELKGQILDKKHTPIVNAHLYLKGLGIGTITNKNGKFNLKINSSLCEKELVVSHVAYRSYSLQLDCNNLLPIVIKLEEKVIQLEGVNVTDLSAKQIIYNAINNLENNFNIESVNYTIFSRYTEMSNNTPVLLEESVFNLYHTSKNQPQFNIIKVRCIGFDMLGKNRLKEARLIGIHSIESHLMLRYTADFLKKNKLKKYKYEITDEITFNNEAYYVVSIKSDNYLKGGEIWINKEDFGIAYLKEIYQDEFWKNISRLNTVKESMFKKENGKWYFTFGAKKQTLFLKKEDVTLVTNRLSVATLTTQARAFEKSDEMGRMSKMLMEFNEEFNDDFWDNYNYIPLDSLFNNSLTLYKK